jgi:CNT family concentrative nucleoside transporter
MMEYFFEHNRYLNIVGILVVLGVAWIFSRDRSKIKYTSLFNAFLLQIALAFITLKTGIGQYIVGKLAHGITQLYLYAEYGSKFLFGSLAVPQDPWGFVFAFRVLPIVIFFGALIALLFHYRIIQAVTTPITRVLYPLLGTSAAETLCAVANSFLGQTEAPLLIRNYLSTLTRSEMLTVMVAGMGTISGPLLSVYAAMGVPVIYLLSASVMSIPTTILISKMLLPETQEPETKHGLHAVPTEKGRNVFDALGSGTHDGLQLALAVGAMLIAFISLIAFGNGILGWLSFQLQHLLDFLHIQYTIHPITLEGILGTLFAPVGWLMGLSSDELFKAGQLLGIKLGINEMVAYAEMVKMSLSDRAVALLSVALCGFANFSSIGIQLAGIGALAQEKRSTLSELGLLAVLGGTLSNLLNAFVVGLVL